MVFGGCATPLSRPDQIALERHNVPAGVSDKMRHGQRLSLPDIVALSKRGLSPEFIVRYLHSSYEVYGLSSDDVVELKRAGVSKEVIDYLLATPRLLVGTAYGPLYPAYDPFYGLRYYPWAAGGASRGFSHHHR